MSARILFGKECGAEVEKKLLGRVDKLVTQGVTPHLAVILVGDDPASKVYVGAKERACERLGMKSTAIRIPTGATQSEISARIEELNKDELVHGILLQSPVPGDVDELAMASLISPAKDVDGFHPTNLGYLVQGRNDGLLPCTPAGVMELLDWGGIEISRKHAVVVGRSRIVGMPLALMLARKGVDATVTIAHSRTPNLADVCGDADILVAAVGRAEMVKSDWVKLGAVVIDVGVNRVDDASKEKGYRLTGDVEPSASKVASVITPVPGGVGPMTIAMLMSNTVRAAESALYPN